MAFCCWIGSIDPHGELRPKCGCLGFRDWKGKNKAALRTAKTVRAGVIDLVRDLEKEHSLLVTPRGLLDDAGELVSSRPWPMGGDCVLRCGWRRLACASRPFFGRNGCG